MKTKNKKTLWLTLLSIALAIVLLRMMLPIVMTSIVNAKLKEIPGIEGHIADIDLSILGLEVAVKEGVVTSDDGSFQILTPRVVLSLDGSELIRFRLATEVKLISPVFQFYELPAKKKVAKAEQNAPEVKDARFYGTGLRLRRIIPSVLQSFQIENGNVEMVTTLAPVITKDIQLKIRNVATRNSRQKGPGEVQLTATTPGEGNLTAHGVFDPLDPWPDGRLEFKIMNVHLAHFAKVTRELSGVDAEKGLLSLVGEAATSKGKVDGYIKPLIKNLDLTGDRKNEGFWRSVWEHLLQGISSIFKSEDSKKVAAKIVFRGDLTKPGVSIWSVVKTAYKNAFGDPLDSDYDRSLKIKPSLPEKKTDRSTEQTTARSD